MPYYFIEHTADIAFRVWGKNPEELFADAAKALVASMVEIRGSSTVDREPFSKSREVSIHCQAPSTEELLVKWLTEILLLFEMKGEVALHFVVSHWEPNKIEATVTTVPFDPTLFTFKTEIKAVTFHELAVQQKPNQWETTVVLDV